MKLLIRWAITGVALFAAAQIVPGIQASGENEIQTIAIMAIVLGLVNALIKPVLSLLTCSLQILTLGLFTFVLNALMLWLASWAAQEFLDLPFVVDGFVPAFLGALIVSVVSAVLEGLFLGKDK